MFAITHAAISLGAKMGKFKLRNAYLCPRRLLDSQRACRTVSLQIAGPCSFREDFCCAAKARSGREAGPSKLPLSLARRVSCARSMLCNRQTGRLATIGIRRLVRQHCPHHVHAVAADERASERQRDPGSPARTPRESRQSIAAPRPGAWSPSCKRTAVVAECQRASSRMGWFGGEN